PRPHPRRAGPQPRQPPAHARRPVPVLRGHPHRDRAAPRPRPGHDHLPDRPDVQRARTVRRAGPPALDRPGVDDGWGRDPRRPGQGDRGGVAGRWGVASRWPRPFPRTACALSTVRSTVGRAGRHPAPPKGATPMDTYLTGRGHLSHYKQPGSHLTYCGRTAGTPGVGTRPCRPCVKAEARDRAEATAVADTHREDAPAHDDYGACEWCGWNGLLRKDGTMRKHRQPKNWGRPGRTGSLPQDMHAPFCKGSGQPPHTLRPEHATIGTATQPTPEAHQASTVTVRMSPQRAALDRIRTKADAARAQHRAE